jgi:hypothetical protein
MITSPFSSMATQDASMIVKALAVYASAFYHKLDGQSAV